jgi:hypothetical protein
MATRSASADPHHQAAAAPVGFWVNLTAAGAHRDGGDIEGGDVIAAGG